MREARCHPLHPVAGFSSGSPSHAAPTSFPMRKHAGFSLIELLAVMAIIIMMMGLLLPSLSGWGSVAGRRGAVTIVMNTLEQARVAALESGRNVIVVLWRREYPERDAIKVLRETEDGSAEYEQLTKWTKLPERILLHEATVGKSALSADPPNSVELLDPVRLPSNVSKTANEELNYVIFSPSGSVLYPQKKEELKLIITEGVRGDQGSEAVISDRKQSAGGFEIISLSRYTGRVQLDISTLKL